MNYVQNVQTIPRTIILSDDPQTGVNAMKILRNDDGSYIVRRSHDDVSQFFNNIKGLDDLTIPSPKGGDRDRPIPL